jgi:hypothetical protein
MIFVLLETQKLRAKIAELSILATGWRSRVASRPPLRVAARVDAWIYAISWIDRNR